MKSSRFIKHFTPVFRLALVLIFLGIQAAVPQGGLVGNAQAASAPDAGLAPQADTGDASQANPRPLLAATADVGLTMPTDVFLGEDFTFQVSFDNNGADPGYGPFVDLVFPVTGADGDDGIDFVGATYLGADVESVTQTFPDDGGGTGCVDHPWLRDNTGAYVQVCGTAGDKLVSLKLPFGSFVPEQPPVNLDIQAHLSNLADLSTPLSVKYRGGYMYGETPLDDWCCGDTPYATPNDPDSSTWPDDSVSPIVMTAEKLFTGHDNVSPEIPTGETHAERYVIDIDIATGETMNSLQVVDDLPDAVQYISYMVTGATVTSENSLPSTSTPGGTFDITLGSVTGVDGNDVSVEIYYFVPRLDVNGDTTVDPTTGTSEATANAATVNGAWQPTDPRDAPTTVTIGIPPVGVDHKSLEIQKEVQNITDASNSPGDVMEYTLTFQVSDFFAFDELVVEDLISDGQHFDSSFTPTLEVAANPYALAAASFSNTNYDVFCNYTGGPGAECDGSDAAIDAGKTRIEFRLSDEIITRGENGRLVGGCVDPVNGSNPPDCATYNDGKTEGTITFRVIVQEEFTDDYPSSDSSVDQGDSLNNAADVEGRLLDTQSFAPTGNNVTDDSTASFSIGRSDLSKSIYAINSDTNLPTDASGNIMINPGDEVTYRLTYDLPTSDVEELTFADYFPLPVFDVDDPDQDGASGPAWTFSSAGGIPASGVVTLGNSDTFYQYMVDGINNGTGDLTPSTNNTTPTVDPVLAIDAASNKLMIYYANYDDTRNSATTVDLFFTITVSAEPFADGLLLTNQGYAFEGSTNSDDSTADAIIQFVLGEPVLVGKKGIVWTSNPNSVFDPNTTGPGGVTFTDPTTAPRWTGTINSSGLDANPIDSNIQGVDAGDIVTFAITIENQGTSLDGAFDIQLRDILDTAFYQIPTTGLNLQIYYGDGVEAIPYRSVDGSCTVDPAANNDSCGEEIFEEGIEMIDPVGEGACQAHDPNLGNNVIMITYDLQIRPDVIPGDTVNTVHLMNYAGSEGGPNHLPEDQTDTANATVLADFEKTLEGTQVTRTNPGDVGIGELVTYTLTATVPEGEIPHASMTDQLDGGLVFAGCTSVIAYSGGAATTDVTTDLIPNDFSGVCQTTEVSGVTNNGTTINFDLGNITNTNRDDNDAETLEITYQAVVTNVLGNQGGTLLNNAAEFFMDEDGAGGAAPTSLGTDAADDVTVVEPDISLNKVANPTSTDAGNTVTYTVTLTNGNAATDTDAYELEWTDTLPAGTTYVSGTLATGTCPVAPDTLDDSAAPTLTATWVTFPKNTSCELTFDATVDYSVNPGETLTNTANAEWTSMPGDVTDAAGTYSDDDDERTGADGVGGLNDYVDSDNADVTITQPAVEKYLVDTSESHTAEASDPYQPDANTPAPVAIGEIVRYRIVATIPEGTSPNFQLREALPNGLTFLDDGTANLSFISNSGIASTGTGVVPAMDASCNDTTFADGVIADGDTPASLNCALAAGNISGTLPASNDTATPAQGGPIFFRLGDLSNTDSDAGLEYVVLEFNALVHNSTTNQNDAGDLLANTARVFIDENQNGDDSSPIYLNIVEPHLTVDKNLVTAATDAGDPMTYRISITNDSSGASAAAAFDLTLSDTLDTYLDLQNAGDVVIYADGTNGSSDLSGGSCGSTAQTLTDNSSVAADTVSVDISCLNPGETVVVDITAYVESNVPAGYTIGNTASVTGSSLPGSNGTTGNSTGSDTPGGSGTSTGERDGSGTTTTEPNDIYDEDSAADTILAAPTITKSAEAPGTFTLGDTFTYDLLITLPESVTQDMVVFDDIPEGLAYVSHEVITTTAAANSQLTADYNGTFTNDPPTVTSSSGSGDDLTLDFGDTTTVNDNDSTNNTFQVRITVRMLNESDNQNGDTLTNTGEVQYTNPSSGATDSDSDTANIDVIEPELNIDKAADSTAWLYYSDDPVRGTVTYTLTISHEGTSTADAYDLSVTDTIPNELTYVAGSITASAGCTADDSAAPNLTWACASLAQANSATLTYQATVNDSSSANYLTGTDSATNTATVTWTSQSGTASEERDGTGGVNDYTDSDSETGTLDYYAIGNRVWFDTDNSAAINGSEDGVSGVTLELYQDDGTGTFVNTGETANTDADGYYLFDYLIAGDYMVVIPASNFNSGAVLEGYYSSQTVRNDDGSLSETTAPDPDNDTDSDDNGTLDTSGGAFNGAVTSAPVTVGPTGNTEPTDDDDLANIPAEDSEQPDGRSNLSVDFGFYKTEIGNLVYRDDNANGTYDSGTDTPLGGVTVQLYAGDGTTLLDTVTTNASGEYLFTDLADGDYYVTVLTPNDLVSTIDTADSADNADPDDATDNNDNGIGIGAATATSVTSGEVTMSGGEQIAPTVTTNDATGTTTDTSVDFGFTYAYALGNRVWYDTDNGSDIDFGTEVGVDGVTVELYAADGSGNPTGSILATDTTANGGYYLFDYLTADDYVVVIPAGNFADGAVLNGYWSSATEMLTTGITDETRATGATDDDADSDDNGLLTGGDVISVAVTLGPTGDTEQTAETDLDGGSQGNQPDGRANMTVDFGFYKTEIGNLVFGDTSKNGNYEPGESLITGMTVRLYNADGTVEIQVGPDGILGSSDDAVGGVTTNASGEYRFSGLPEGDYIIRAGGLANYTSTIDTFDSADNADPDTNTDNNDNGIGTGAGTVTSAQLTMDAAESAANISVDQTTGTTTDLTVDFGFINAYALGNRVWFDTDNSATINGSEVGVDGVTVQLYAAGDLTTALATDTTANGGYYLFDYLDAGDYVVVIPASEFNAGGTLEGYWSSQTSRDNAGAVSETTAAAANTDTDSDDNGTLNGDAVNFPGAVVSSTVTLGTGASEPTGEADLDSGSQGDQPDAQANMTVDFGFYKTEIGNLVYFDNDADGTYNAASSDTLADGVAVELFAANGTTSLATTTTAGGGLYSFDDLPEGDYIVKVTSPAGTVSTIDSNPQNDNDDPNINADNNDNGDGTSNGTVESAPLTMDAGNGGAQNNNTVDNSSGTTTDPTLDFGFVYSYALGNRVWFDTDNSSTINGSEVGVNGVTVELYAADGSGNPTGAVLATDITSSDGTNDGYYLFDYLFPGDYVVVIPASNFADGAVLNSYHSSATEMLNTGITNETRVTGAADDDVDSDDNGLLTGGDVISVAITLGPSGDTEQTGETDLEGGSDGDQPDGRANMTVDFGFYKTEIGNLVFGDVDKNGNYDNATDTLYNGVSVQLFAYGTDGTDGIEIQVGPDGILGTADDAAGGTTTNLSGEYRFSGLPAGNYVVRVISPTGTVSTIDTYDAADSANPDTNTDNNDNGIGETDGTISANSLTMTAGDAGAQSANTVTNATGTTLNPTVDFGFTTVFALGNRVWFDTNNNAAIDGAEAGINDVTVNLYAADGSGNPSGAILATTTTANGGYYLFDYLEDGDYVVVIPASEFGAGETLENYWSSTTVRADNGTVSETTAPDPDTDLDSDDNGVFYPSGAISGVYSAAVTLGPTAVEPAGEGDLDATVGQGDQPDTQANMTVDFGFYTITLGDLVWDDANNSGTLDGAEAGIDGVDVQLWTANGNSQLDTATTAGGGIYGFSGLIQGNYRLIIPDTEFQGAQELRDYYSSTGGGSEPAPNPDADFDNSDDNGSEVGTLGYAGGYIQTDVFALTPGAEDAASSNNALGLTAEPRVDFGVFNAPQTDLSVSKDDGQTFYLQGGTLVYTIVVSNAGPADVIGAVVSDNIPAQIASWDWACTATSGGAGGCDAVSGSTTDFNDTVDLPINGSITYTVTATVDAAATGLLTNTVTVTPPAGVVDTDNTNNSADDADEPASLTITKDDSLTVVAPGSTMTYSVTITNNGNVPLTDLTVVDTLPADLTYQSATPAPSDITGGVLTWDHASLGIGGDLAVGASTSLSITVVVNDTPSGTTLTNTITVTDSVTNTTATDDDTDSVATTNTKALVDTNHTPTTFPEVTIGEILTYRISLVIPAGATMTNLRAVDTLDTGLAFDECQSVTSTDLASTRVGGIAAACPLGGDATLPDPAVTDSGHHITFDFGDVTNTNATEDRTLTVEYWVDVLDIAANVNGVNGINNAVIWEWDGGSLSGEALPVEIVEPDMEIDKSTDHSIAPVGATIPFTLEINHSSASSAHAYDVVVTDELPSGLEYVNGSVAQPAGALPYDSFSYDALTGTITIVWDYFPLNATSTVTFDALFVGPAPVTNEASVVWTSLEIDPSDPNYIQSEYNEDSTERWYDPNDQTGVDDYGASSSVLIREPALPRTGFAPNRVTTLPAQPASKAYETLGGTWIEIPKLNVQLPIVGVPLRGDGWDLTWLDANAGYLEGTAYPGLPGNTAITAHVYLPDGEPGPFVDLHTLYWGDEVILHANGQRYIYQIRETRKVWPNDLSALRHEDYDWLTLITCQSFNEKLNDYDYRIAVRAVLTDVQADE